ncbi:MULTISPECIES: hypothetical protein [unclassified Colwellia]|uniref:hypothetical protein n=1 Tax=unclassified Colwellia TaxID=196834 RepID=UPI0015F58BA1|nr:MULTISPECIES: hypothetical protein [unclassified Colwellia]MBA6258228.1 hypothetical protein [Colwellia sp. MB3u-28]MBA6259655.1 hypothetical protein [Colwellia sp. MB3u-41]
MFKSIFFVGLLFISLVSEGSVNRTYVVVCKQDDVLSEKWHYFITLADIRLSIISEGGNLSLINLDKLLLEILHYFLKVKCLDPDMVESFGFFEEQLQDYPLTSEYSGLENLFNQIRSKVGTPNKPIKPN